jgi:hypothetical protein
LNGKHIQLVKIRLKQTYDHEDANNSASPCAPTPINNSNSIKNSNTRGKNVLNVNAIKTSNQFLNNEIFYI